MICVGETHELKDHLWVIKKFFSSRPHPMMICANSLLDDHKQHNPETIICCYYQLVSLLLLHRPAVLNER